jgi:hypothetical protein
MLNLYSTWLIFATILSHIIAANALSLSIRFVGMHIVQRTRYNNNIFRFNALTQPTDDGIETLFDQSSVPEIPTNFYDDEQGNVNIPSTGISISDEIEAAQKDRFVTDIIPITGLLAGVAAQLVTVPMFSGSFESVRYLVALSPPTKQNVITEGNDDADDQPGSGDCTTTDYAMVDIPPFSVQLLDQINEYLVIHGGKLRLIVSTNRNSIHYDESPAIYSTRRADLNLWCKAFPDLSIVAYRLDIPRDCRYGIAQVLDGYGPFALQEKNNTFQFIESGRPLIVNQWDHAVTHDAFRGKPVPDDSMIETESASTDDSMYTPDAIRERELGNRLLGMYTPGYTFGSVSYIFPEIGICCSGFTIPVEDNRYDENLGVGGSTGPALDCRGYIATSKNRKRQMESAKNLVNAYVDRFRVILPARGDPLFLDDNVADRKELLLETIAQYEKIGSIYEQLGIISGDNEY